MTEVLKELRQESYKVAILPEQNNSGFGSYQQLKYRRTQDLPFLWLIEDSGAYQAQEVGNWDVIDLGSGPESFVGFVTVLVQNSMERGGILRTLAVPNDLGSELSLVPVIDVSGLGNLGYRSEDLKSTVSINYKAVAKDDSNILFTCERSSTEEVKGTFFMPNFDMNQLLMACDDEIVSNDKWQVYVENVSFLVRDKISGKVLAEGNVLGNGGTAMFEYSIPDNVWNVGQAAQPLVPGKISTDEEPK
jgi:hypothetical protein